MPATTPKPKAAAAQGKEGYLPPKFVRCELTKPQKDDLVLFRDEIKDDQVMAWVNKMVEDFHVLSVKHADYGYMASMTGVRGSATHENLCLTVRASTPRNALVALMFRDRVVLDGLWSQREEDMFDI